MLTISIENDNIIFLAGRFDASQVDNAKAEFEKINSSCTIDFSDLDYISSAGLGVFIAFYQRLNKDGGTITLRNMSKMVRDVFKYSRLDTLFTIE